jgi:hypothetical protein
MGDSLKSPHSVSLKVLRSVTSPLFALLMYSLCVVAQS